MDEDTLEKHIDEMGTISSSYYRGDYTLEETVAQIEKYILNSAVQILKDRELPQAAEDLDIIIKAIF